MTKLELCPFCGENPVTSVKVTQMGYGEDSVDFKVVCEKCGTEKVVRLKIRRKCDFALVEQAMNQVISAWNHRVMIQKDGDNQ